MKAERLLFALALGLAGTLAAQTPAIDSGGVVMGSAGKEHQHGFGVAARRSYIDVLLPLFLDDGFTVKPRWFDYQAKYQYQGKAPWSFPCGRAPLGDRVRNSQDLL